MSGDVTVKAIGVYGNPPHGGSGSNAPSKVSNKESLFSKYRSKKEEEKSDKKVYDKYFVNKQAKEKPQKEKQVEYTAKLGAFAEENKYSVPTIEIRGHDKVSQFLNSYSPDFVFDMLPEDILNNTYNKTMLNSVSLEESMRALPKKGDGSYDIEKIREDLEYAVNTIKTANNDSIKKMDYGTYKNFINGADIYNLLLGPEISCIAEQKGLIKPQRMFSLQDLDALNILSKTFDFELPEGMEFKDSFELKNTIEEQNKQLDKLLKIDLSTEKGIKELLSQYARITQTSFSCDEIEKAKGMMQPDSGVGKGDKFNQYVKTFGSVENYMDVWKNELYTGVAYEVIFKIVVPKIINKSVPYGKYFAPFIPALVETHETLSSGLKEGEIINKDNVNSKEFFRVLADAGIHAAIVSDLPLGKFGDGLREVKVPKAFSKNRVLKSQYKTAYRWTRGGAKAITVNESSKLPSISGAMFDKGASRGERDGYAIFNMLTGYILVPAGLNDLHGSSNNAG